MTPDSCRCPSRAGDRVHARDPGRGHVRARTPDRALSHADDLVLGRGYAPALERDLIHGRRTQIRGLVLPTGQSCHVRVNRRRVDYGNASGAQNVSESDHDLIAAGHAA